MGTHLGMQNFDKLFNRIANPIIVNDVLDTLESEKNAFDENFFVTYTDTDLLDTIPKCPCGHTFGQHHIGRGGKATICRECKMPVQPMLDKPLEAIIWVQAPKGVDALINPKAWGMMSDFFTLAGNSSLSFNIIKYLTNTDYRPSKKRHGRWMQEIDDIVAALGEKRGLNTFYRHFDKILEKISLLAPFQSTRDKREKLKEVLEYVRIYRKEVFAQFLPVHNKTILVIENTKFGTYMDTTLKTVIDAVRNISGIDSEIKDYTVSQKENRASKFSEAISDFGRDYEKNFIAGKPGLVRKHVYATRCWFSFRAVINSLTQPHAHDEIHLPWSLAVTTFRLHLMGKLYRRGYGHNDAAYFLNAHTYVYHPLLDEIFEELLAESPHFCSDDVTRGIPCIFGRNPSMYRTSIQRMFITKIKKDPKIQSISYPIVSVAGPNADFDGDQMFGFLTMDNWTTEELRMLAPHFGAWKLSGPRKIGDNMPLPKPIVSSVVNYLYNYPEHQRRPDPVKRAAMEKMFSIRTH